MNMSEIEQKVIDLLMVNISNSGYKVPEINTDTDFFQDIEEFDSIRAVELLVELSEEFKCELLPKDMYTTVDTGKVNISDLALDIKKALEQKYK